MNNIRKGGTGSKPTSEKPAPPKPQESTGNKTKRLRCFVNVIGDYDHIWETDKIEYGIIYADWDDTLGPPPDSILAGCVLNAIFKLDNDEVISIPAASICIRYKKGSE